MALDSAVLPGALLLATAAIVCVVLLIRSRHPVFAAMLAVLVVTAATPGALLAWDRSPLVNPTSMHVDGLVVAADPGLSAELVHHLISEEGDEYRFVARGGPDQVAAILQSQHPDGVVTTADPMFVSDPGHSIWHVTAANVRFDLIATTASDAYALVTQTVRLHPQAGGPDLRIPFPRSAFGATDVTEGQIYTDGWTQEQWAAFYEGVTDVTVDGNLITVPTDAGTTATITLSEGISKITIDD